jgi:hypothetical protein
MIATTNARTSVRRDMDISFEAKVSGGWARERAAVYSNYLAAVNVKIVA